MLTFLLTSEYSAVAEEPMLILATSPIASLSSSVNTVLISSRESWAGSLLGTSVTSSVLPIPPGSPSSDRFMPLSKALISSCDSIPSINYSSSLITDVIRTA